MFVILLTANFKFRNRSTCSKRPMKRAGKVCGDSQDLKSPGMICQSGFLPEKNLRGAKDNRPLFFKTIGYCFYCSFYGFFENFRGAKVVLPSPVAESQPMVWLTTRNVVKKLLD